MLGVVALSLQWSDVAPWREKFAQLLDIPSVSGFGTPEGAARVAQTISTAGAVAVVPPVFCSSAGADYGSPLNAIALEVEIMAARANARMPSVYLSRHSSCGKTPDLGVPSVLILLKDDAKSASRGEPPPKDSHCDDFPIARMCIVTSK